MCGSPSAARQAPSWPRTAPHRRSWRTPGPKVVDAYDLKNFDIEGGALPDAAANTKRAQAIAGLQKSHSGLDVSFTLPVMPDGLTQAGTDLLENAKKNGVTGPTMNIMAMDYGPSYDGDMGQYAIDAATATHRQVKKTLGVTDDGRGRRSRSPR